MQPDSNLDLASKQVRDEIKRDFFSSSPPRTFSCCTFRFGRSGLDRNDNNDVDDDDNDGDNDDDKDDDDNDGDNGNDAGDNRITPL